MSAGASFGFDPQQPHAVLSRDVTVRGEIWTDEPLTIEGKVSGIIEVAGHLLTIAPSGNVNATVKAKEVDVLGSLQGEVEGADKIYIRDGARFVGDIQAYGIVIEDGGSVRATVNLLRQSKLPFSV
jgi:cytoskeletal protein CcmA (bactofilin family)